MASIDERQDLELELQTLSQRSSHDRFHNDEFASVEQGLKPADGGRAAWTVLIAAFIFEALFWGFPMSFGVFQNYYSTLPEFQDDRSSIPHIGTVAQGLVYLAAPLSVASTKKFPRWQRQQIWVGWPLCIIGLLTASFTNSVAGLIATQGVLYGIGFVTIVYPILSMLNEWWVTRKGMAFGLISAASGATGAVMPFILEALLHKYGRQITLRACAVAMVILTAPLLPLLKGRLPPSETAMMAKTDWSFFKKPLFWIYGTGILVQGMGFFFPVVFLPSYATFVGLSAVKGALLLALMSIAQVLGQTSLGFLSDKKISVGVLSSACCVAAAAAAFGLWGPAKSMPLLTIFSLIYGFFGFGFGTLRVAMGRAISNDPATVLTLFAVFVFLQGIGNILVGPISAALLSGPRLSNSFGAGLYGSTVVLTGVASTMAAVIIGGWYGMKRIHM